MPMIEVLNWAVLHPRRYLVMSEEIFGGQNLHLLLVYCEKKVKHKNGVCKIHRIALHSKEMSGPKCP